MLTSTTHTRRDATVVRLSGVLDARTYQQVRDTITKAAVDSEGAVIIDIDDLYVRDDLSWAVFTSARWLVQQWPDIPMPLVAADRTTRKRLRDNGITRYVPVYATVDAANAAIAGHTHRFRRRARAHFGPNPASANSALIFVREHLVAWSMREKVAVASTVVTVFAENALSYTRNGFDVRLEALGNDAVVAVSDSGDRPAVRPERPPGAVPSGLDIVAALCPRWGNTPTQTGKTVWARIGPDDTFANITGLLH